MLHLRRRKDSEKGQILVLFTLVLVVILAFASMVVDLGLLRNNRQTLVNAFDSAALAGGTTLPVDGSVAGAATKTNNLIVSTINANYPGIPSSAYTISYKCLIGVDTSTPPKPFISRDVPLVCDPHFSLGHNPPVAADFVGSGPTRYSSCNPAVGDKCNAVVIAGRREHAVHLRPRGRGEPGFDRRRRVGRLQRPVRRPRRCPRWTSSWSSTGRVP